MSLIPSISVGSDSLNFRVNPTISAMRSEDHFHVSASASSLAASDGLKGSSVGALCRGWEKTLFQGEIMKTDDTHATTTILRLTGE